MRLCPALARLALTVACAGGQLSVLEAAPANQVESVLFLGVGHGDVDGSAYLLERNPISDKPFNMVVPFSSDGSLAKDMFLAILRHLGDQFGSTAVTVEGKMWLGYVQGTTVRYLMCHSGGSDVCLSAIKDGVFAHIDELHLLGSPNSYWVSGKIDGFIRSGRVGKVVVHVNDGDSITLVPGNLRAISSLDGKNSYWGVALSWRFGRSPSGGDADLPIEVRTYGRRGGYKGAHELKTYLWNIRRGIEIGDAVKGLPLGTDRCQANGEPLFSPFAPPR